MTESPYPQPHNAHVAAALIGGTALIGAVLVTHHPVVARTEGDPNFPFGGLAAIMQTNLAFHAILMLVVIGQFVGLILFARRLGLHRPLVLAGLLLCGFAALLLIIAMTFDGFVIYELISRCSASSSGCGKGTEDALRLALAIIQGFTKLGFGAQCLGFMALGGAMWALGGKVRIAAVVAVSAAALPIVMIGSGAYVGPQQLMEILAVLAGWSLCVAAALILETTPFANNRTTASPVTP